MDNTRQHHPIWTLDVVHAKALVEVAANQLPG